MHVVVLGGAANQLASIDAARRLGGRVTVVDPRGDVPGVPLADSWLRMDVLDTETIATALGTVDAVLTDQSDYAARGAAALARRLGLPGQDPDLIEACTNKFVMRSRVHDAAPDLVPRFQLVRDPEEASSLLSDADAPMVIKPLQSQGSRGVSLVPPTSIDVAVDLAFGNTSGPGVLVEEAVRGREYSVDGIVRDGRLMPLGIAAKTHYAGNPCLDERCDFLPTHFGSVEADLLAAMDRIITALGITFGIVHAELLAEPGRATLVEIALRGGGGGISSAIVPHLSGIDPAEELLRDLLGLPGQRPPRDFRDSAATLRFLPPGPVPSPLAAPDSTIAGWESLVLSSTASPIMGAPLSSEDRMGSIILVGATEGDVARAEAQAMARLGYGSGA